MRDVKENIEGNFRILVRKDDKCIYRIPSYKDLGFRYASLKNTKLIDPEDGEFYRPTLIVGLTTDTSKFLMFIPLETYNKDEGLKTYIGDNTVKVKSRPNDRSLIDMGVATFKVD